MTAPQLLLACLGGGQLGRMLAIEAAPLGVRTRFLDPNPDAVAFAVGERLVASFEDNAALAALAQDTHAITCEFENVPASTLAELAAIDAPTPRPGPRSLAFSQDRLWEKRFFLRLGIRTPDFAPVRTKQTLHDAADEIGLPAILKTRRFGYDGKGQWLIKNHDDIEHLWPNAEPALQHVEQHMTTPSDQREGGGILEQLIHFDREVSATITRDEHGNTAEHPVSINTHESGILTTAVAGDPTLANDTAEVALGYAGRIAHELQHVGTLALELFDAGGALLANEFAPRVHNSAHWTIEACPTSQFANHARAVLGIPLGPANFRPGTNAAACINILSTRPDRHHLAQLETTPPPNASIKSHIYGKAPRTGRKLGHITITATDHDHLNNALNHVKHEIQAKPR